MLANHANLLSETLLTLKQAAEQLPVSRCHQTVLFWIRSGCDGRKLESVKIGGRRFTSKEALDRFFAPEITPPIKKDLRLTKITDEQLDIRAAKLGLKPTR
jgi:hypothetical protein